MKFISKIKSNSPIDNIFPEIIFSFICCFCFWSSSNILFKEATILKIIAVLRIAVPYTGMIISTRESAKTRERLLHLGISQISGGSKTSVGGYYNPMPEKDESAQFDVSDRRPLDEVIAWLIDLGYIPSFCTACYRKGRTGENFMDICKQKEIHNFCQPNALMTLKEYLEDYATEKTKEKGKILIEKEVDRMPDSKLKEQLKEYLLKISDGERDYRF